MIKYSDKKFDYSAECETLEELLEAVGRLPLSIESLSVPTSLAHFSPGSTTFKEIDSIDELVEAVKKILTEVVTPENEKSWGVTTDFDLCSYYGGREKGDAYYIRLSSDASKKFASDMSSGKYGRLD